MRLLLLFFPLVLSTSHPLFAASGDTIENGGFGSIRLNQESPYTEHEVYSDWTLVKPGNDRVEGTGRNHEENEVPAGQYTFFVDPIEGASAIIELYRNNELVETFELPQISFEVTDGDSMLIDVRFQFTRTGNVSVRSEPQGFGFILKGPNETEFEGVTPASYENVVEGLYTVYFKEIENCVTPRPLSQRLEKDSRVNLSISFSCTAMPETPQAHEEEERSDYVTVTIGGERITFTDAPMKAWYAPYVARVARAGIITGYRDKSGNLTGKYGTIDNVTLAQLAKIAHEVAGIDEMKARSAPRNQRAKGTWFEKYIASAESLHWQVFSDHRVDPSRPATRGEVTTTLLQALNVLRVWPLGKMFHDVAPTSDYAASIETAAKDDVVSGYTNSYGNPTGQFGPDNPVNRAEMAKFVGNAIDVYIGDSPEILVE